MKMYYVVNAFMPNKKAYGIQIAKMCEAFLEAGVDLTLIIPRTSRSSVSMREAYGLRVDVPTRALPALAWYNRGRFLFFLSSIVFMATSGIYLYIKRLHGEKFIIYTVDMSTFSFASLSMSGSPVIAEMHDVKPYNIFTKYFFDRAQLIIVTNDEIRQSLKSSFDIPDQKLLVEPNGVDLSLFTGLSKSESRQTLGLPTDAHIALYVGRFYDWKGLEILPSAATNAPSIDWYVVGGTREEFIEMTRSDALPANLHIVGECAPNEVGMLLAAADVLLVLGTKKNEQSYRHTAPMKIYEYMASSRPIVASRTPALTSIISEGDVVWYGPDNAASLAQAVEHSLASTDERILERNLASAHKHSWSARAARIQTRIATLL